MLEDRDRLNGLDNVDEIAAIIYEVGWADVIGYLMFVERMSYRDIKLKRALERLQEDCKRVDRRYFGNELVWRAERRAERFGPASAKESEG